MEEFGDLNVFIDTGYLYYFNIFSAFNMWSKNYPERMKQRCPEKPTTENLPDITTDDKFIMCLEKRFQVNLDKIFDVIRTKVFDGYTPPGIKPKFYFCMDSKPYWRSKIYPEYKMQRKFSAKYFNTGKAFNYLANIIVPKMDIGGYFGIKVLQVDTAEADDIIMTIIKRMKHPNNIIIGTDHDFIQVLGNARMFDLTGKEITTKTIAKRLINKETEISEKEYLLTKLLMGDKSDNLPSVFDRCGPKTAYKLVKSPVKLRSRLVESGSHGLRLMDINRRLIDCNKIPLEIQKGIIYEYCAKK